MTTPFAPLPGPSGDAPRRRHLRTFAFDPMSTRLSGEFLTISVPFEPDLERGPRGVLLEVVDYDPVRKLWYKQIDLNETFILLQDGLTPAEADPRSHQQIVYAVAASVIERFERYLGRRFRWRDKGRLALVPHAFEGRNAFFDPEREAVLFGYYRADSVDPGANLPEQMIFTCLSNDIIAHEVTHAIVHRLRPHFAEATNSEVFAWHEAFADLIALFQHFAHRGVVREAIASTAGNIERGGALFDLASEFGAVHRSRPGIAASHRPGGADGGNPHTRSVSGGNRTARAWRLLRRRRLRRLHRPVPGGGGRSAPDGPQRSRTLFRWTTASRPGRAGDVRSGHDRRPIPRNGGAGLRLSSSCRCHFRRRGARNRDVGLCALPDRRRSTAWPPRRSATPSRHLPESVMSLTDSALVWPAGTRRPRPECRDQRRCLSVISFSTPR